MRLINYHISGLFCLVFAAFATASFAQQPEAPKQDLKVTIIKKTIDGKGVETVEKIEQYPNLTPLTLKEDELMIENRPAMGVIITESEQGVRISTVQGAAKEAGMIEGDIILSFAGTNIKSVEQLQNAVKLHKIGDKVKVEYLRDGKKLLAELTLKAAEREIYLVEKRVDNSPRLHKKHKQDPCQKLSNLRATAFLGVYINTENSKAEITDLIENTAAAKSKLKIGDVITKINEEQIGNYAELVSVLKKYKPGQMIKIGFEKNGKIEKANIRLGSLADRDPLYTQKLEECCSSETKHSKNETEFPSNNKPQIIVELFPNPASQIINLNFNAEANEPINISINNIEGKELIRLEMNANQGQYSEQINIEKLPKGIYLMTIKQGKIMVSRQFSKI
jgi:hypothetical protein